MKVPVFWEQEKRKSEPCKAAGLGCREQKQCGRLGRVEDIKGHHRAKRTEAAHPPSHLLVAHTSAADRYHSITHLERQGKVSGGAQSQSCQGAAVPPLLPSEDFCVCLLSGQAQRSIPLHSRQAN